MLHGNLSKMAEEHVDGTNYTEYAYFPPLYDQF